MDPELRTLLSALIDGQVKLAEGQAKLADSQVRLTEQVEKQGKQIEKQGKQIEKQGKQIEKQGMQIEKQGMQIEKQGMQIEKRFARADSQIDALRREVAKTSSALRQYGKDTRTSVDRLGKRMDRYARAVVRGFTAAAGREATFDRRLTALDRRVLALEGGKPKPRGTRRRRNRPAPSTS